MSTEKRDRLMRLAMARAQIRIALDQLSKAAQIIPIDDKEYTDIQIQLIQWGDLVRKEVMEIAETMTPYEIGELLGGEDEN